MAAGVLMKPSQQVSTAPILGGRQLGVGSFLFLCPTHPAAPFLDSTEVTLPSHSLMGTAWCLILPGWKSWADRRIIRLPTSSTASLLTAPSGRL